jgi:Tol biopolymer transport system component
VLARLGAAAAASFLLLASPASATFRGRDGLIAYTQYTYGIGGTVRISIGAVTPTGGKPRTLIKLGHDPAWSPDGKHLAFVSSRSGGPAYYVANADGTNVHKLIALREGDHSPPVWSADGHRLVFQEREPTSLGNDHIWTINADGTRRRALFNYDYGLFAPACSPNGKWVAFILRAYDVGADRSHPQSEIVVLSANGGRWQDLQRITRTPGRDEGPPSWTPDGRLAFDRNVLTLRTAHRRLLVIRRQRLPLKLAAAVWSPDGTKVAFDRENRTTSAATIFLSRPNGTHLHRVATIPGLARDLDWQPVP